VRNIIIEDRSWIAELPGTTTAKDDRRLSTDPVSAALVTYNYARV
jgi:hypothetical protein